MKRLLLICYTIGFGFVVSDSLAQQTANTDPKPAHILSGTGNDFAGSLELGIIGKSCSMTDTQDTNKLFDHYGESPNDVFYRFTLAAPAYVIVDHLGSQVWKTNIYLVKIGLSANSTYEKQEVGMGNDWMYALNQFPGMEYEKANFLTGSESEQQAIRYAYLEPGTYYIIGEKKFSNAGSNGGLIRTNFHFISMAGDYYENPIHLDEYESSFETDCVTYPEMFPPNRDKSTLFYDIILQRAMNVVLEGTYDMIIVKNQEGEVVFSQDNCDEPVSFELLEGLYYIVLTCISPDISPFYIHITGVDPNLEGDTFDTSILIDAFAEDFVYHDSRYIRYYTNQYQGSIAPDIFYCFKLIEPMTVTFKHRGSTGASIRSYLLSEKNESIFESGVTALQKGPEFPLNLEKGIYYYIIECDADRGQIETNIVGVRSTYKPPTVTYTPDSSMNYILTVSPTQEGVTEKNISLSNSIWEAEYYDLMGRPIQHLHRSGSPIKQDIITHYTYKYGKINQEWLPVSKANNQGHFIPPRQIREVSEQNYSMDTMSYSSLCYDGSPLDRIVEQYGPGQNWYANNKSIKRDYLLNTTSGVLSCRRFDILNINDVVKLQSEQYYDAGELTVVRICDEDNHESYRFEDKSGNILLKRAMTIDGHCDTHYIYDHLNNLRFVLPPMASSMAETGSLTDETLDRYAYQYSFDSRRRCVAKKYPGSGWIYLVYDTADRLVFMQDAQQRVNDKWSYTLSDDHGRPVISGICRGTETDIRTAAKKQIFAIFDPTAKGPCLYAVSDTTLLIDPKIQQVNYYDNYQHKKRYNTETASELAYEQSAYCGVRYSDDDADIATKGCMTGTVTAVVDTDSVFYACSYYDYYNNLVQRKSQNPIGGISNFETVYNFNRKVVKSREKHTDAAEISNQKISLYHYDHAGRLLLDSISLNDSALATNYYKYDELGRLVDKASNPGERSITQKYEYNTRGWLTSLQSDYFGMKLCYEKPLLTGSTPSYIGNITEWSWKQGEDADENVYSFTYDKLSRLKIAKRYVNGVARNQFLEGGLVYDRNGNIQQLLRIDAGNFTNDFEYTYNGNNLIKLTDRDESYSYAYDQNGNMTFDGANKLGLTYNHLNLIEKTIRNGGVLAEYSYLSNGVKVSATNADGDGLYYLGSLVYHKQGSLFALESARFNGGWFISTNNVIEPHYHLTDHLGSVRVVVNGSTGKVEERNDYYPFGMRWDTGEISNNRYRYNGKEDQSFVNNPYTDYGARMYDSRFRLSWNGVDPLAEEQFGISPYTFCNSNPIRLVDKDGRLPVETIWDAANVADGVRSLIQNISTGNVGGAIVDGVGIVLDAAATVVPYVPGGVHAAIKAARGADKAINAVKTADKAVDKVNDSKKFGAGASTDSRTAKEALGKAKDQNGIPRSQQPNKTIKPNTPAGNASGLDSRNVKQYEYSNSKGKKVIIRQDKTATYPNGGNQPAHFNAGDHPEKLKQHHNYGN